MGFLLDIAKDILDDATSELTSGQRLIRNAGSSVGSAVAAGLAGAALMRGINKNQPNPTPAAFPQAQPGTPPPVPVASTMAPAPPVFSFYAIIEGVRRGPYNEVQFKRLVDNNLADATTMVWQDGMAQWLPAGDVKMMDKLFSKNKGQQPAQGQAQQPQPTPLMPQMPQQKAYYVNVNNQMAGPFTTQQLQQFAQTGEFTRQMYVWCEGMPEWLTAGNVKELASLFGPAMPQMPTV